LRDKWEFGLEIVAFQYLPMFLGETQESQEQEGQMHVIAAKLQGFF